jgi:hypothetical protein
MATIESWAVDLTTIGPAYPMLGSEFILFIIGLVCWIGWHVIQIRNENEIYAEDLKKLDTPEKVKQVMESHKID